MTATLVTLLLFAAPPATGEKTPPAPNAQAEDAKHVQQLEHCEQLAKCPAAVALLKRGKLATEALLKGLKDPKELVRFWSCGVLSELRDPRSFEPLVAASNDPKVRVQTASLFALGSLGDKRATPILVKALSHKDVNLRIAGTLALGRLGDPAAVAPLIRAINDKDEEVRGYAILALGDLGAKDAVDAIRQRLREDMVPAVVAFSCIALSQIGDRSATRDMISVVSGTGDIKTRAECAAALGRLQDPAAKAALVAAQQEKEPLKSAAKAALDALSAKPSR